jgi:hypothetical protein
MLRLSKPQPAREDDAEKLGQLFRRSRHSRAGLVLSLA